jgi:hypothetical protein
MGSARVRSTESGSIRAGDPLVGLAFEHSSMVIIGVGVKVCVFDQ